MAKGEATFVKQKGRKIKTKVKRPNSINNLKVKQKYNKDGTLKKTVTKFRGKRTVVKPKKEKRKMKRLIKKGVISAKEYNKRRSRDTPLPKSDW